MAAGVVLKAMQVNKRLGWTIRDFGPLPVPRRGDTVNITIDNYRIWLRPILFEGGKRLDARDGIEFFVTVVVRKPQDNRRPLKDLFGQAGHYVLTYYPPSHLGTIIAPALAECLIFLTCRTWSK